MSNQRPSQQLPPPYAESAFTTVPGPGQQPQQQNPYQVVQTVAVPPAYLYQALPEELQPNDYMILSLVVTTFCGFLNLTSLVFSLPAVVCSTMAFQKKVSGNYAEAKRLGNAAAVLCVLCVFWVMIGGIVTVSVLASYVFSY